MTKNSGFVTSYTAEQARADIIRVPAGSNARDAMHYEKAYEIQTDPNNIAPVRPERIRL